MKSKVVQSDKNRVGVTFFGTKKTSDIDVGTRKAHPWAVCLYLLFARNGCPALLSIRCCPTLRLSRTLSSAAARCCCCCRRSCRRWFLSPSPLPGCWFCRHPRCSCPDCDAAPAAAVVHAGRALCFLYVRWMVSYFQENNENVFVALDLAPPSAKRIRDLDVSFLCQLFLSSVSRGGNGKGMTHGRQPDIVRRERSGFDVA